MAHFILTVIPAHLPELNLKSIVLTLPLPSLQSQPVFRGPLARQLQEFFSSHRPAPFCHHHSSGLNIHNGHPYLIAVIAPSSSSRPVPRAVARLRITIVDAGCCSRGQTTCLYILSVEKIKERGSTMVSQSTLSASPSFAFSSSIRYCPLTVLLNARSFFFYCQISFDYHTW